MAAPTIPNSEEHFFTTLYEGNGAGQRVGKFVPFTDNGTIANSVLYNDNDSPYLTRTQESGSGDQKRKATFSWWFKRGSSFGTEMIHVGAAPSTRLLVRFDTSNRLVFRLTNGTTEYQKVTNRTFEDNSKWYHCHWQIDVSQSTATDRSKVWINGDQITSWSSDSNPAQNTDVVGLSDGTTQRIGCGAHFVGQIFDGYLAEFNYCDGVITTVDNFGVTDTSTGRWIPKTLSGITYGSNGFRLKFQDSSALGDDTSGNTNDFTSSGLTTSDQTTDSPTQNHAILSSSRVRGSISLSEGNLKITSSSTNYAASATTFRFSETASTGLYFEVKNVGSSRSAMSVLIMRNSVAVSGLGSNQQFTDCFGLISRGGGGSNQYWLSNNGSNDVTTGVAHASDDYIQVAFKDGKVWYGINNTWIFSGNPATGANPTYNNISGQDFRFLMTAYQNNELECNFGQKSFNYTPPTGFVAVQQDNLPETSKGVSGLTWTKNRDGTDWHYLVDSSRGNTKSLNSNDTAAEETHQDGVQKFLKGGISVEDRDNVNKSGNSFVNWTWVANSGTTSSNTDGNVTCNLQVNNTAKFSIQTWTNTGAGTKTIGHGLGVKPGLIIQKRLDTTSNWFTYHHKLSGNGSYLHLNNTDTIQTGSDFANTEPTTSVFSSNASSSSSATFVSYCFAEVEGFSKFGHYIGNGVADGPFIYTGFKPAFIIFKSSANATNWYLHDAARSPINPVKALLDANSNPAESSAYVSDGVDFLSNGFKVRQPTGYGYNYTSQLVYIAFAEHPFVGDGTSPVTAR